MTGLLVIVVKGSIPGGTAGIRPQPVRAGSNSTSARSSSACCPVQDTGLATRFIEQCSSWFGHLMPWNVWAESQHASTCAANATAASWGA